MKDERWYPLKEKASSDRDLPNCACRFFFNLVDHLAKKSGQRAGDPFVLCWRTVRKITGGADRGVSKPQAYRYIRALEDAGYIFETPKAYVRDFLVGKQSYNPAAVKFFNIPAKKLVGNKVTREMWSEAKKQISDTPEANKPRRERFPAD